MILRRATSPTRRRPRSFSALILQLGNLACGHESGSSLERPTTFWLAVVMRPRRLMIVSICLAATAVTAFLALKTQPESPLDITIVRVEANGDDNLPGYGSTKAVSVELRRRNPGARFTENMRVQTRVAHRWQVPKRIPKLDGTCLLARTNCERVVLIVSGRAEACRFLLEYRVGSPPYCQAYSFLQRHGLYQRFPRLCRLVLRRTPQQPRLRNVELELSIPAGFKISQSNRCPLSPLDAGRQSGRAFHATYGWVDVLKYHKAFAECLSYDMG